MYTYMHAHIDFIHIAFELNICMHILQCIFPRVLILIDCMACRRRLYYMQAAVFLIKCSNLHQPMVNYVVASCVLAIVSAVGRLGGMSASYKDDDRERIIVPCNYPSPPKLIHFTSHTSAVHTGSTINTRWHNGTNVEHAMPVLTACM